MTAESDPDPDPVATTRATYERVAAGYEARNAAVPAELAARRDEWAAMLPRTAGGPARVLDAGCGPGWHAAAFAGAGLRAVALDLASAMAALARGRGVPVVRGDLRRLPFADRAFGGVWSSAALLHVPRADVPATLAEWRRVTADGGLLALSTATGAADGWEEAPYDRGGGGGGGDDGPALRWFVFHEPDALCALLAGAGWRVTSVGVARAQRVWVDVRAVAA